MRKYFEDDAETIERWKFGAAFIGVGAAWWIVLALSFGII